MKIRTPAVEGTFYPDDEKELDSMLDSFFGQAHVQKEGRARAMIVPHAGLVYSGLTAAYAYKYAEGEKYRSAVIFAPSHRVAFYGISAADFDVFEICGRTIKVNRDLTERLVKKNGLVYIDQAHAYEHSAEVQLPFVKKYIGAESIAVFVYGETDAQKLSYVIDDVLEEGEDLVIISSDLSHYHSYDECSRIDSVVEEAISKLDAEAAGKGEACGMTGIQAMLASAARHKLRARVLDRRNSGDIVKDRSGVVGYLSAVFI